jgi:hypothetical protein
MSNAVVFALSSSQSDFLQGNSPVRNGEVTGAGIIEVAAAPVTVSLVNAGAGSTYYAATVPVKANLVVFMDESSGNTNNTSLCFSIAQLTNIIAQLITLYPTSVMSVFTTNLNTLTGTPYQLYSSPDAENGGLFILDNGGQHIAVPIMSITAIYTGDGTVYAPSISYLTPPQPLPQGCDTDLIAAIHAYLPVPTEVVLRMGVAVEASGAVYKNEYGILVLSDADGNTPIYVSVSKLASIAIVPPADAVAAKKGSTLSITNKQ